MAAPTSKDPMPDFLEGVGNVARDVFQRAVNPPGGRPSNTPAKLPEDKMIMSEPDDDDTAEKRSLRSNTVNINGPDPIQGFDVGVWVEDMGRQRGVLLGQFTSILLTIRTASEPYLAAGSKQPIYLDGETQISFTLEKGLQDMLSFRDTTGFKAIDSRNRYIRGPRFRIIFEADPVDWMVLDELCYQYGQEIRRYPSGKYVLEMCKFDVFHLGAKPGKDVVSNQWTGVAERILVDVNTIDEMPESRRQAFGADGDPKNIHQVPTFGYSERASNGEIYSGQATTWHGRRTPSSATPEPLNLTANPVFGMDQDPDVRSRPAAGPSMRPEISNMHRPNLASSSESDPLEYINDLRNERDGLGAFLFIPGTRQRIDEIGRLINQYLNGVEGPRSLPPAGPRLTQETPNMHKQNLDSSKPDSSTRLQDPVQNFLKPNERLSEDRGDSPLSPPSVPSSAVSSVGRVTENNLGRSTAE